MITLISSVNNIDEDDENRKITVYNFMIQNILAFNLQTAALKYLLDKSKLSEIYIRETLAAADKDKYLLISLLKKQHFNTTLKLYDSSIIPELSEAGFVMDPRTKDPEGLSAFHYAIISGDFEVLNTLYYFAANCSESENTYRNPDPCIVLNLFQLGEILSSHLLKLKSDEQEDKELFYLLFHNVSEFLRLNDFLLEINKKILNIKYKLNYYEKTPERVFKANKRIDIIITLLDTYKKFFNFSLQENSQEIALLNTYKKFFNYSLQKNSQDISLDKYKLHRRYYNMLDMDTAVIFFDNIFLLRESLRTNDTKLNNTEKKGIDEKSVSEMESSFFLLVLYHTFIESLKSSFASENNMPELFLSETHDIYPLYQRQNNLDEITYFTKRLRKTTINKETDLNFLFSNEIISIFYSYPEVKDNIHVQRLKHSVTTALNVEVKTDVRSVLVIERALQVIGEYTTPEKNDNSYLKRCLSLCLPDEINRILRRLRNDISHLKSWSFISKFECEKSFSLFISIQKEISEMENYFKIVYVVLHLRSIYFIYNHLILQNYDKKSRFNLYNDSSTYRSSVIDYIYKVLFCTYKRDEHILISFFEILLKKIKDNIINGNLNSGSSHLEETISEIIYNTLNPLKWFLELSNYCVDSEQCQTLIHLEDMYNTLCKQKYSTIDDFKASVEIYFDECDDFHSELKAEIEKINELKPLNIDSIECFLKTLKGFTFLSEVEKKKILDEIPKTVKDSVKDKDELVKDFSSETGVVNLSNYQISYFSPSKLKKLKKLFKKKDPKDKEKILGILNSPDPITELKEVLSKSSVGKEKYEELCKIMNFSKETRQKLEKLVAGQEKIPGNNLQNLFNRITLLKECIIKDNEEVYRLWSKIESENSRRLILDEIAYMRDPHEQVTDMLLFDCMMIFETVKVSEKQWIKSKNLYSGVSLRNVLSHGSPLLETLFKMIEPDDLHHEKFREIRNLVGAEDAIEAIIDLHKKTGHDYEKVLQAIDSDKQDKYCDLRNRIKKCEKWRDYVSLLPRSSR